MDMPAPKKNPIPRPRWQVPAPPKPFWKKALLGFLGVVAIFVPAVKSRIPSLRPVAGRVRVVGEKAAGSPAKAQAAVHAEVQRQVMIGREAADFVEKPAASAYTVKRGDSLWKIAQASYGRGERWIDIWHANRENIREPDLIYHGQELVMPEGEVGGKGVARAPAPLQKKTEIVVSPAFSALRERVARQASAIATSLQNLSKTVDRIASGRSGATAKAPTEQLHVLAMRAQALSAEVSSAPSQLALNDAAAGLLDVARDAVTVAMNAVPVSPLWTLVTAGNSVLSRTVGSAVLAGEPVAQSGITQAVSLMSGTIRDIANTQNPNLGVWPEAAGQAAELGHQAADRARASAQAGDTRGTIANTADAISAAVVADVVAPESSAARSAMSDAGRAIEAFTTLDPQALSNTVMSDVALSAPVASPNQAVDQTQVAQFTSTFLSIISGQGPTTNLGAGQGSVIGTGLRTVLPSFIADFLGVPASTVIASYKTETESVIGTLLGLAPVPVISEAFELGMAAKYGMLDAPTAMSSIMSAVSSFAPKPFSYVLSAGAKIFTAVMGMVGQSRANEALLTQINNIQLQLAFQAYRAGEQDPTATQAIAEALDAALAAAAAQAVATAALETASSAQGLAALNPEDAANAQAAELAAETAARAANDAYSAALAGDATSAQASAKEASQAAALAGGYYAAIAEGPLGAPGAGMATEAAPAETLGPVSALATVEPPTLISIPAAFSPFTSATGQQISVAENNAGLYSGALSVFSDGIQAAANFDIATLTQTVVALQAAHELAQQEVQAAQFAVNNLTTMAVTEETPEAQANLALAQIDLAIAQGYTNQIGNLLGQAQTMEQGVLTGLAMGLTTQEAEALGLTAPSPLGNIVGFAVDVEAAPTSAFEAIAEGLASGAITVPESAQGMLTAFSEAGAALAAGNQTLAQSILSNAIAQNLTPAQQTTLAQVMTQTAQNAMGFHAVTEESGFSGFFTTTQVTPSMQTQALQATIDSLANLAQTTNNPAFATAVGQVAGTAAQLNLNVSISFSFQVADGTIGVSISNNQATVTATTDNAVSAALEAGLAPHGSFHGYQDGFISVAPVASITSAVTTAEAAVVTALSPTQAMAALAAAAEAEALGLTAPSPAPAALNFSLAQAVAEGTMTGLQAQTLQNAVNIGFFTPADVSVATAAPGIAGIAANAAASNISLATALGIGGGNPHGLGQNMSISQLGNLANNLGIANPTAQQLSTLAGVRNTENLNQFVQQNTPPKVTGQEEEAPTTPAPPAETPEEEGLEGLGTGLNAPQAPAPTTEAPPSEISETGLGVPGQPSVPGEEGNTGAPAAPGVDAPGTDAGGNAPSGPAAPAATGEGPAGGGAEGEAEGEGEGDAEEEESQDEAVEALIEEKSRGEELGDIVEAEIELNVDAPKDNVPSVPHISH